MPSPTSARIDRLDAEKTAILEHQAALKDLQKCINLIDPPEYHFPQDIKQIAQKVYNIFQQDWDNCEKYNTTNIRTIEMYTERVKKTTALLTAEPGEARVQALAEYLTLANAIYGDPKVKEQEKKVAIAMLILGTILMGVAVALTICLFMQLGPFVPVIGAFTIKGHLIHAVLSPAQAVGIAISSFSGIFGIVLTSGGSALLDGNSQSPPEKTIRALHAAFFKASDSSSVVDASLFKAEP